MDKRRQFQCAKSIFVGQCLILLDQLGSSSLNLFNQFDISLNAIPIPRLRTPNAGEPVSCTEVVTSFHLDGRNISLSTQERDSLF